MTNEQFDQYYVRYGTVIRAIARKVAQHNTAVYDDLVQEGAIALWLCTPEKARDNEDAFIRQAVKFRMIDYLRKMKPKRFRSLTQAIENGAQLVRDEATGELHLSESTRGRCPAADATCEWAWQGDDAPEGRVD